MESSDGVAFSNELNPPNEAEIRLKELLSRQLTTSFQRVEQVDFTSARGSVQGVGYGASGLSSLTDYKRLEAVQRSAEDSTFKFEEDLKNEGFSEEEIQFIVRSQTAARASTTTAASSWRPNATGQVSAKKRKARMAHPEHLQRVESAQQAFAASVQALLNGSTRGGPKGDIGAIGGRHLAELEATMHQRGQSGVAHLFGSSEDVKRKPLALAQDVERALRLAATPSSGITPLDRARARKQQQQEEGGDSGNDENSRSAADLFAAPGAQESCPDLRGRDKSIPGAATRRAAAAGEAAMEGLPKGVLSSSLGPQEDNSGATCVAAEEFREPSEEDIRRSRLTDEELRAVAGGRFVDHQPGRPSQTLYIKNLSSNVTAEDLVGLFIRFQQEGGEKVVFRLMQRGRMKGQAFVTFADAMAAEKAMALAHGYTLRGTPMVILFSRKDTCNCS
eukprot:jgi/Mesen1/6030/ME000308S05225